MQWKTQKQLNDVRDAAAFILQQTRGLPSDAYKADRLLRQAIEIRQGDPTSTR